MYHCQKRFFGLCEYNQKSQKEVRILGFSWYGNSLQSMPHDLAVFILVEDAAHPLQPSSDMSC